jgi:hypothetical protein
LRCNLSLEGRKYDIACGQIDIGNAATELSEPLGRGALQPNGTIMSEPRIDVHHVVEAVLYMAGLPLDTNVQSWPPRCLLLDGAESFAASSVCDRIAFAACTL